MSCQIKLVANIVDVPFVRRSLFPLDDLRGSDSWLHLCQISASPTGDIIALSHEKRLVVLSGKWDSSSSLSHFQATFSESITENDKVTSVLCLPIVALSHSSHVGPDWTCIILGFESGYVRYYTEDCEILLEEQFHNEQVISLKCQSQHSPRPDISTELRPEELYVHYSSNVCVVSGSHLFTTLRNCRSNLVRRQALDNVADASITAIATNSKKWGFVEQYSVNDIAVVGLNLANTFDHLLTASTCGGFESKYRAVPPHNNLVLGAGSKPFVGFHYALEGGAQPVLSDVAKAVASKLKSALPGWLVGTKKQTEKQASTTIIPAEPMGCRFGLCDLHRTAGNIILSPDRKLAAVSDFLGRVMLIDTYRGIAMRIFKGYREAQCSFIQVPDERKVKHRATKPIALFLVIYSPKKGTLEIFSAQMGSKIATFSASKYSHLLYINYGLLGFQSTSKSRYICQYTCLLIDSDGQIKEIIIPFHFSLTEKNSKRVRDLHLYKRLKQLIKSGDCDDDKLIFEAFHTCSELKTTEIKLQCLDMLVSSKEIFPEVILKCTDYFIERIGQLDVYELDNDTKSLKAISGNLNLLVNFHVYISTQTNELDLENGNIENAQSILDTKLVLGVKEMNNLQKLLDLSVLNNVKSMELKVSFHDNNTFTVSNFLSIFNYSNCDVISLKSNLAEQVLFEAAEAIFKTCITKNSRDYEEFRIQIKQSKIVIKDLLKLVLNYWINRSLNIDINLEKEMQNLSSLIYSIVQNVETEEIIVDYNNTSPFWNDVRDMLVNSSRAFSALIAAIICKSVAQRIERENDLQQSASAEDDAMEVWEKLSQEHCEWTLLIGKLEDVSLLNIILANDPVCKGTLPKLKHEKANVSLKYILEKGRGSVSELVSNWLTIGGVRPQDLILNDAVNEETAYSEQTVSDQNVPPQYFQISNDDKEIIQSQLVFSHLNILKKQFPYSLNTSHLLANMAWEYALCWQKDIQDITHLEACIKCLTQVPDSYIRQGLYNLIWNTHLKIIFESCCKLVNKVGKLPKERLCLQDTGLTDFQVTNFIEICTNFFDSFMDTVQQCYNCDKILLHYEPLWENEGLPLVELTLNQNQINYDLLLLHYQLSLTIQMLATFSIKHTKFINNLFDPSVTSLFFTDLQQKIQINWHRSESKINSSRMQFLVKIISVTIETITVNENKIYSTDHVNWMSKCLCLARYWSLDVDFLKRYQVVQLFSNGFDLLAEELLPAINDLNKLGLDLLEVAGKRLSQLLASSQDLGEKIAAFGTTLTQYLDTLNGEWCAPSTLESTLILSSHILRCLKEELPEHKLALLMLEACSVLQELQS